MKYDTTFSPWWIVALLGLIAAFAIADKWDNRASKRSSDTDGVLNSY